jgi:HEAT repeat protein
LADDASLAGRVAALEETVALLNRGAEHLMDRGAVPLSPAKAEELRGIVLDGNRPPRERLNALRLLRRNDLFTDDLAAVAAEWLGASTDAGATRELLENLRGAGNAPLAAVMQNLATTATDRRVREVALENLRSFVEDPQIEALVSSLAVSDPSPEIRGRAEDVLRRISLTPERTASLTQRALNPAAPLDERLLSLRVLRRSEEGLAQVAPALAQTAQATVDPQARLKLFTAFDEVNRPEFMLPLVEGAQDPNAEVRRRAANALVDYRDNPTVQEWLKVLAASDPDAGVREQAARAFAPQPQPEQSERRRGGPGRR